MKIDSGHLDHPAVQALLAEHLHDMTADSPAESVHALDLSELQQSDVRFWTVWDEQALMGCGALKALDESHAEIKSMRTATAHLRKGVAAALLAHMINDAYQQGFQRISLETGSADSFTAARRLYERFGFVVCPPFGHYREDPHSVFMTRSLDVARA